MDGIRPSRLRFVLPGSAPVLQLKTERSYQDNGSVHRLETQKTFPGQMMVLRSYLLHERVQVMRQLQTLHGLIQSAPVLLLE